MSYGNLLGSREVLGLATLEEPCSGLPCFFSNLTDATKVLLNEQSSPSIDGLLPLGEHSSPLLHARLTHSEKIARMTHRHSQLHERSETLCQCWSGFRSRPAFYSRHLALLRHHCDPILLGGDNILGILLRHMVGRTACNTSPAFVNILLENYPSTSYVLRLCLTHVFMVVNA